MDQHMVKVSISQLRHNPFRELEDFPLDREKIDKLKESITATGFWGTIVARKKGSAYEIAFGHHRKASLEELQTEGIIGRTEKVDIIVRELTNEEIIQLSDAKSKLGPRLVALGHRSDVADLLGAMDIFCLPSYREGMPRSIIEAMMMELPVVATDIRGSREEVVHEETGLLVPTHNSAALAEALGQLMADPDLSCRMGKSGRQRALKLYDERRVVARQINEIMARCHGA